MTDPQDELGRRKAGLLLTVVSLYVMLGIAGITIYAVISAELAFIMGAVLVLVFAASGIYGWHLYTDGNWFDNADEILQEDSL